MRKSQTVCLDRPGCEIQELNQVLPGYAQHFAAAVQFRTADLAI